MENNQDALNALDAVSTTRASLADKLVTPWWYYPAVGACVALVALLVGNAFGETASYLALLPVLGLLGLAAVHRRVTGVDIAGHSSSDGSHGNRAMLVLLAFLLAGLLGSLFLGDEPGNEWAPWVIAAVLFIGSIVLGQRYSNAVRADLRAPRT